MSARKPYRVRFTRTRDGAPLSVARTAYATPEAAQAAADEANAAAPYVMAGATYDVTAEVEA